MSRLASEKRSQVIAPLVEGTSINATCRMTGVAKHTVLKLLKDLGCACLLTTMPTSAIFARAASSAMKSGHSYIYVEGVEGRSTRSKWQNSFAPSSI